MEMFLKRSYKLMFKFDVFFDINIKLIKKLHLTVQKGAECCMYPCDVINSVA